MRMCKHLRIGLPAFLIFALLCAPALIAPFTVQHASAATQTSLEPEEPANGQRVNDPHEGFNRAMFKFNDRLFYFVVKPVSTIYAAYFPPGFRAAVQNGFRNIVFPARFVNSILQGKSDKAGTETVRFLINSTMGVGGLFDVAERNFSIAPQDEDFGQTLAVWGANSGFFMMLPIFGPSNPRDLVGFIVDSAMDPIIWIPAEVWVSPTVKAGKFMNNASLRIGEYEDFKKSALDPYVSMRDAYIQYRDNQIKK
ncbi:MAG: VacJ family lipoprotein [Syntrophobacteraceae bacterium]